MERGQRCSLVAAAAAAAIVVTLATVGAIPAGASAASGVPPPLRLSTVVRPGAPEYKGNGPGGRCGTDRAECNPAAMAVCEAPDGTVCADNRCPGSAVGQCRRVRAGDSCERDAVFCNDDPFGALVCDETDFVCRPRTVLGVGDDCSRGLCGELGDALRCEDVGPTLGEGDTIVETRRCVRLKEPGEACGTPSAAGVCGLRNDERGIAQLYCVGGECTLDPAAAGRGDQCDPPGAACADGTTCLGRSQQVLRPLPVCGVVVPVGGACDAANATYCAAESLCGADQTCVAIDRSGDGGGKAPGEECTLADSRPCVDGYACADMSQFGMPVTAPYRCVQFNGAGGRCGDLSAACEATTTCETADGTFCPMNVCPGGGQGTCRPVRVGDDCSGGRVVCGTTMDSELLCLGPEFVCAKRPPKPTVGSVCSSFLPCSTSTDPPLSCLDVGPVLGADGVLVPTMRCVANKKPGASCGATGPPSLCGILTNTRERRLDQLYCVDRTCVIDPSDAVRGDQCKTPGAACKDGSTCLAQSKKLPVPLPVCGILDVGAGDACDAAVYTFCAPGLACTAGGFCVASDGGGGDGDAVAEETPDTGGGGDGDAVAEETPETGGGGDGDAVAEKTTDTGGGGGPDGGATPSSPPTPTAAASPPPAVTETARPPPAGTPAATPATDAVAVGFGAPCTSAGATCWPGLTCGCDGTCGNAAGAPVAGAFCATDADCPQAPDGSTALCVPRSGGDPALRCHRVVVAGGSCAGAYTLCQTGFACTPPTGRRTCVRRVGRGAACGGAGVACWGGLTCRKGVCGSTGALDAPCDTTADCVSPLLCVLPPSAPADAPRRDCQYTPYG